MPYRPRFNRIDGQPIETTRIVGSSKLEVFSIGSDWPVARLQSTSVDHDRFQTNMADVNAYFPKDHLRAFSEEGAIASFADECVRILPNYSKRKISNVDASEVLRRLRDAAVDAVVLTPI